MILLLQLDGTMPNVALMRIAAHHRARGERVELRRAATVDAVQRELWDRPDRVYASAIFVKSKPVVERVREVWPQAVLGGTGVDPVLSLEQLGINTLEQDYSIYPKFAASIGFTQRGCRLRCGFCVVPTKEGAVREERTVAEIWRGEPWPRHVILLDNDFFGQPRWADRIEELRAGDFRVSFSQGINARFLDDETAAAIASVNYYANDMKTRRIYTAWDNTKDEVRLFRGLESLVRHGVKPNQIMVYMLIGYQPGETHEEREHRRQRLREFGARPYPMPFDRTPELVGYQRWVVTRSDSQVSWEEWAANRFDARHVAKSRKRASLPVLGGLD